MKDFFDTKVFITVLIALIAFSILNKVFLEKQIEKMFAKQDYENVEEIDEIDDEI
jgi:hypothetical protein